VRIVGHLTGPVDNRVPDTPRRRAVGDVELGQDGEVMPFMPNKGDPVEGAEPAVSAGNHVVSRPPKHVLERWDHPKRKFEERGEARREAVAVVDTVCGVELGLNDRLHG
jgi:hypothetical protein